MNVQNLSSQELFTQLELAALLLSANYSKPMEERFLKLKQELDARKHARMEQGL